MISSLSGVRGVLNRDIFLSDFSRLSRNFVVATGAAEVLVARDSRSTGPAISRAVAAAAMSQGADVVDYGIISTPALFRESRTKGRAAVMVTASHNEPEFNGAKFIVSGAGIGKEVFDKVTADALPSATASADGLAKPSPRPRYSDDLVSRFGAGSCEGMRVALDLGGGAAISHSVEVLRRLGCQVFPINDSYGAFCRTIDPVADDLGPLRALVRRRACQIGLGFDCDGDRLVVVDSEGKKRTGDFMLTLALSEMLAETGEKKVVVSVDTTQAVDDVVEKRGGKVARSKVGEANVVGVMSQERARLGGEGSSGGLIDGAFNYCRDSMLAALVIIRALKSRGTKLYRQVPSYHQARLAVNVPREEAARAIRMLAREHKDADTTDGVKLWTDRHSWVLVRPSGTEDIVRVSAEAATRSGAEKIAGSFAKELKELSR